MLIVLKYLLFILAQVLVQIGNGKFNITALRCLNDFSLKELCPR